MPFGMPIVGMVELPAWERACRASGMVDLLPAMYSEAVASARADGGPGCAGGGRAAAAVQVDGPPSTRRDGPAEDARVGRMAPAAQASVL